jgi:hypothetical protein
MKPKLSDIYHPGQKVTFLDVEWTVTKVQDESYNPYLNSVAAAKPTVKATLYLGRVIPGRETEQCDVSNHITELVKPKAGVTSGLAAAMQQGEKQEGQNGQSNLLDHLLQYHIERYEANSEPVTTFAEQVSTSLVEELRTMGLEIRPITDPK